MINKKLLFITFLMLAFSVSVASAHKVSLFALKQVRGLNPYYEENNAPSIDEMTESILGHVQMCKRRIDGKPAYFKSCRTAHHGCENRIRHYASYFIEAGKEYNLNPWLLAAMAYNETRMNPFVKGPIGERGISQLHPKSKRGRRSKFVQSEWYRRQCARKPGNCQRDIVFKQADHVKSAMSYCKTLIGGLSIYNTGNCDVRNKYVKNTARAWRSLKNFNAERNYKILPWCDSGKFKSRWERERLLKRRGLL